MKAILATVLLAGILSACSSTSTGSGGTGIGNNGGANMAAADRSCLIKYQNGTEVCWEYLDAAAPVVGIQQECGAQGGVQAACSPQNISASCELTEKKLKAHGYNFNDQQKNDFNDYCRNNNGRTY